MEHIPCENQAACPLVATRRGCFEDTHHLQFPAYAYNKGLAKLFREQDFNKVTICRALHEAIHASGYIPVKPTPQAMALEMWDGDTSRDELEVQLDTAEVFFGGPEEAA